MRVKKEPFMTNNNSILMRFLLFFAVFYLVISPGLYVDKFDQYLSLPVALLVVLLFFTMTYLLTGRKLYLAIMITALVSAYIPNSFIAYLVIIPFPMLIIANILVEKKKVKKFDVLLFIFICYTTIGTIVNLNDNTDVWCLLLYMVTFVAPMFIASAHSIRPLKHEEQKLTTGFWLVAISFQILPLIAKPFAIGMPELLMYGNDLNHGTMIRAHYLGVLIIPLLIYLCASYLIGGKIRYILLLPIYAICFALTDTKHALASAFFGLLVCVIVFYREINISNLLKAGFGLVIVSSTILPYLYFSAESKYSLAEVNKFERFIGTSRKIIFMLNTVDILLDEPLRLVSGLGAGSYGSRAASSRAVDSLYKEDYKLPSFIPPYASRMYDQSVGGLFLREHTGLAGSNVIQDPFSSFVGMIAELGLIGFGLIVGIYMHVGWCARYIFYKDYSIVWRSLGISTVFTIPYLFGLSFFDTYFSQPQVMIPIWTLYGLILARKDALEKQRKYEFGITQERTNES
jgi:hypothetical protein